MNFKGPAQFQKRPKRSESPKSGHSTLWIVAAVCVAVILLGSAGAYAYFRPDPKLAAVRQIDKEIADLARREDPQPDDQIVMEALQATRAEMVESLSQKQQDVLDRDEDQRREQFFEERERELDQRLTTFFAMPKDERIAAVDKMIEESEAWRKAREAELAQRQGDGAPAAAQGRGQGNRGGRGWGGRNATPAQRKDRERRRLDNSTPMYRAQRTEFVRLVQQRRKDMGLPPASNRALFGMYRQLAPPSAPGPGDMGAPRVRG